MKNSNVLLIGLLILTFSCNHSSKKKEECQTNDTVCINQQFIDYQILETVNELKKEYPQLNRHSIAVYFTDSLPNSNLFGADSAVFIAHYDLKTNFPQQYYKGVFKTDSVLIMIYEKNNVGAPFYDASCLLPSPLNEQEKSNLNVLIMTAFIIKNDSLLRWIAP